MSTISLRIPQIGEGLQEARLVATLKKPGDKVKRDEPIYQMETDKAVMDVESPYEGTLVEWLAPVDAVLPIGGEVARMEVAGEVRDEAPAHGHSAPVAAGAAAAGSGKAAVSAQAGPARNAEVPPRTRAYAKEKGIAESLLASIPASGSKLMPRDIDAFLSKGEGAAASPSSPPRPEAPATRAQAGAKYDDAAVPQKQRILNSRMVRGNQLLVPGTISCVLNWEPIAAIREKMKSAGGDFQPSAFTIFAYAVAQALKEFPAFRTSLPDDDTYRTYKHAQLGIAVSLPGDELVVAVIEDADALGWREFAERARDRIELARSGKDQVNEAVTISLTNMQHYGIRDAVPVVVPPSMATLFIGEVYTGFSNDPGSPAAQRRLCNLGLTFDHRVVNGVGAANFLKAIREKAENISALIKA